MIRNLLLINIIVVLLAGGAFAQDGAVVHLTPPDSISGVDTSSGQDRGIFFHMLRGFELEAVRVRLDLSEAGTVSATVYESNGVTRGALVATGNILTADLGNVEHMIPLSATLDACAEYEVAIEFGNVDGWDYRDEIDADVPYVRNGVVQVRSASNTGSAASVRLPIITLVGASPPGSHADLTPPGFDWVNWECHDPSTDRSVFVRALQTVAVTTVGFDYDPVSVSDTLRVKIYDVESYFRGPLVAEGFLILTGDERSVWQVPVNAVLHEGQLYDIAAQFVPGGWGCRPEASLIIPFVAGGVLEVLDGADNGSPSNTYMPHLTVNWEAQVGGVGIDLGKEPGTPPSSSTDASKTRSVYVFPVAEQEAFSIGWFADIPEGEVVTARIYNASGTVRGPLVSEGSIVCSESGERWHDIPVSGVFFALQGYELNVEFGNVNVWRHWTVGSDYYVTPDLQVYGAGADGTGASELPHMRITACYDYPVSVNDRPARPATLVLRAPYPNPVSGESIIEYELDREGSTSIQVFDVRGSLVATLLEPSYQAAGPGAVTFNGRTLPAGIYFVKLVMPHATVSRKVSIIR